MAKVDSHFSFHFFPVVPDETEVCAVVLDILIVTVILKL